MDKEMVSAFMEVTSCESQSEAVQHLGSCRWNLDEAINLYFSNAGGSTKPPGSSDPISPEEDVMMEEATDYGGDDCEDDGRRAPIPSVVAAPSPALSEIVPTGWGEAQPQPDGCGEAGVGNAGDGSQEAHDDDAERGDDIGGEEGDGGGMRCGNGEEDGEYNDEEDNEQYDDMSYIEDEDDEDAYYASLAEETGGQPWPAQPQAGKDSLEELFRPPFELMYRGSFHNAKVHAAREDRFLLVNLQTSSGAGDFPSQAQNRDLWAHELVKNVVESSFVFFLLQKRDSYLHIDECSKVSSFYKLDDDQLPAVLVLDPITGQLLAKRSGTMMPDDFMQYIDEYTKSKPSSISKPKFVEKTPVFPADGVGMQEPEIPADGVGMQEPQIPDNSGAAGSAYSEQEHVPVPETELPTKTEMADDDDEPMEDETMYKLRIRFPDGTIVAKEFGCKRKVASLYAFCRSAIQGGGQAEEKKAIRIRRLAGRAMEAIQDNGGATFEDLGLNCAAVSVVFDT